jgi:hypothetical protein
MVYTLWQKWLQFSEWLGTIIGNAILTVFYFTLFAIPGLFLTVIFDKFGKNTQNATYFSDDVSDLIISDMNEAQEM